MSKHVSKLSISIFRESDSLKELIKEEKFEKVIDHCSELIKSTEDKDARDLAQLLRGTFYILSKQQDLAMSDLGVLIEDDSANSKIRANALIKRASLFIQQCKDPVQDPLKVIKKSMILLYYNGIISLLYFFNLPTKNVSEMKDLKRKKNNILQ